MLLGDMVSSGHGFEKSEHKVLQQGLSSAQILKPLSSMTRY